MKSKTLKFLNKKKLIIATVLILCILILVTILVCYSKYFTKDSIPIMEKTLKDIKPMAIYIQKDNCTDTNSDDCYVEKTNIPAKEYKINVEKTYCYKGDDTKKITKRFEINEKGETVLKSFNNDMRCYLYYDKFTFDEYILSNSKGKTMNFDGTACDSCYYNENGIYEAIDDDGISYYYRGTVENNYVKFGKMGSGTSGADIWWRIIRRNGDGSVRMIFAGTSTDGNVPAQYGREVLINNGQGDYFSYDDDIDVFIGYQYTLGELNGNEIDSNVKKTLDSWFKDNLLDELNASNSKIDTNAGFCGDRSAYENKNSIYVRNENMDINHAPTLGIDIRFSTNKPTLQCPNIDNDLYTSTISNIGTKSLTYPIGLITADEYIYGGGYRLSSNSYSYLYAGNNYWTMTPVDFGTPRTHYTFVDNIGSLEIDACDSSNALRPVINLKKGSLMFGDGTAENPYRTVA